MKAIWHNVSFRTKIFGIATGLLLLLVVVTAFSYDRLSGVNREVSDLSDHLLPISRLMDETSILIFEQEVNFERILKLYKIEPLDIDHIARERAQFFTRGGNADQALERAIHLAESAVQGNFSEREEAREQPLASVLTRIEAAHGALREQTREIFALLEAGEHEAAYNLIDPLEEKRNRFDREIETIRTHLQKLTTEAAHRTQLHQDRVLQMNAFVSVAAGIVGILYAFLFTVGLVRPIRNLMGAMRTVERGDLSVEVKAVSGDEIGSIARAFGMMVDQLRIKAKIEDTFGKYVDPRVVEDLIAHPEGLKTGGEKRVMTVVFTDIDGLDPVFDRLEPEEEVALTNQYLTLMSEPVSEQKGVIDKYMDTMVMAFWGPPFAGEGDHAQMACFAALDQLARLDAVRNLAGEFVGNSVSDLDLHIGLSSGPLVVGNMGSEQARSYTVLGDTVNTASRLKGVSKQYGVRILTTEDTQKQIEQVIETREIDLIQVVGKEEPVRVFEVLARRGELDGEKAEARARFEAGLMAYRAQDWEKANAEFEACLAVRSEDGPARVFLERVAHLSLNPPGDGWDGVWRLVHK